MTSRSANIASALTQMADRIPRSTAVYVPAGRDASSDPRYAAHTYAELDDESTTLAKGFLRLGIEPGSRAALMVRPSYELFAITFALFKAGIVPVLIDPGIGVGALGTCLGEAQPTSFIGVTEAHAARVVLGWARGTVRRTVTVGRRLLWGGVTLDDVRRDGAHKEALSPPRTGADDVAAVLFTSGSTGVPKGAIYTHANFAAQVDMIREAYGIAPGEIDLPTFPLFALFDPALGMTTVLPEMDFTRPARVEPKHILDPIARFGVTNMFGSPALLNRVGRHGAAHGLTLPSLKRVISAGAPVPASVLERFSTMLTGDAEIVTPYGATEALPVATLGSREILATTRAKTDSGAGVCVGRPASGVRLEIIRITDEPIATWSDELRVARGETGEIVVQGPNVTAAYLHRPEATRLAKIACNKGGGALHRMGDVGYVDADGLLWFCGRKSHRVVTPEETLFTDPCEAVFNTHPSVFRSALVGVKRDGKIRPVICIELEDEARRQAPSLLRDELLALGALHPHTARVQTVLFHKSFPVDIRHNAKIFREKLATWAASEAP